MRDFYASCGELQKAKALTSVSAAQVKTILDVIQDVRYFRFFFYDLTNENWLDDKLFRDYLSNNLSLSDRFRPYLVASYLLRVAEKKPDYVTEVIKKSRPIDAYAIRYLLETVSSLPAEFASKLVLLALKWMSTTKIGEGELLAKLVLKLVNAEYYSAAMMIVREQTRPKARTLGKRHRKAFPSFEKTEAVSRLEDYDFEQFLGPVIPHLAQKAPARLAKILETNLVRCFKIEKRGRRNDFQDYSWIWRPSIAGGEGTYISGDIKNTLISALRDVLLEMVKTQKNSPLGRLLARLVRSRYSVLRRIALHTIGVAPDRLLGLLDGFVKKKSNLDDHRIAYELFSLLRENLDNLGPQAKEFVIKWIDAGPDINQFVRWRSRQGKETPSDQEKLDYVNTWKLERLWQLRDNLPERKRQIEVLSRRYSIPKELEPAHLEATTYGYTSPVTVDQLIREDDDTVLTRIYRPERGNDRNSPYLGLALTFGEAVKKERKRFLQIADRLADPVIMPVFIGHYVRGLHEAWKVEEFEWTPDLLRLADFIVQGYEEILSYPTIAYSRPKAELANFIESIVQDRSRAVTATQLQKYRDLLIQIVSDIDPILDSKEQSRDWSFIALNSTSGTALHALIKYALRYAHERKDEKPRIEQEVKDKLLQILQFDGRPSNRSVFGMYLANLWYLDEEWIKRHLELLFPPDDRLMRKVVWDAYVTFNNVYAEIFNELRPQYLRALNDLRSPREPRDARDKLAQHIAIIYWRDMDEITSNDSLVQRFFEVAPIEFRTRFIWQIERGLHELMEKNQLEPGSKAWQRPKALWNWRTSELPKSKTTKKGLDESSAFLKWLPYVPEDVKSLYALIEASLLKSIRSAHVGDVTKYLAKQSEKFPIESAKLMRVFFNIPLDRHYYYFDDKEVRQVLENALKSGREGRTIASQIANKLGEYGRFDYKYIWERANVTNKDSLGSTDRV